VLIPIRQRAPPIIGSERTFYVFAVFEGPVGVGKTALSSALSIRLGARFFGDPLERAARYAQLGEDGSLATELEFLFQRMRQLEEIKNYRDLKGGTAIADWDLCKLHYFAREELSVRDYEVVSGFAQLVKTIAPTPDIFVLLQADVDQILERIARRGRPFESGITGAQVQNMIDRFDEIATSLDAQGTVRVVRFHNADGIRESSDALFEQLAPLIELIGPGRAQ
jgi:deoxyguanosine kinase